MFIYHQAFDTYHCAFRLLLLLWQLRSDEVDWVRLQILDFYLVFPGELESMQFPQSAMSQKNRWKKLKNRYNSIADRSRVFDELKSYQSAGLRILLSAGIISEQQSAKQVTLHREQMPSLLAEEIELAIASRIDLIQLLTETFMSIELNGAKGLKARSKLFEFHYDIS